MRCYIKNRSTFITKSNHPVVDFDIFLASIFDDRSTLVITGKQTAIEGDIACLDNGWMGVISAIDIDHSETTLTLIELAHLFDRPISSNEYAIPATGGDLEQTLVVAINSCFTNVADTAYQVQYLVCQAITDTNLSPMMQPDCDSHGIYTLYAYLTKIRQAQSVAAAYSLGAISGSPVLQMTVGQQTPPTRVIDFSDPSYAVTSERYENGAIAKITVCGDTPPDTVWYLQTDGMITATKPADANRAQGGWTAIYVGGSDDVAAAVANEFAQNKYSHLIEFSSLKDMDVYDNLLIRKDGRTFSSYITSKEIKASSSKRFYKCGELKDFEAKLREALKNGS